MQFDFEETIWIARPPLEVFEFMTTPSNWPHYAPGMVAAKTLGEGPVGPGTQMLISIGMLGTTVDIKVEFEEFEPGKVFSSRNIEDPKIMTVNRTTLVEEKGGTRITRASTIEPRAVFVHLTAPLVRAAVRRNAKREFENVKAMLEQGPDALGPRRDPAAVAPD
ncbi:MAG: SRPBCC family protein [Deltaproteobacteria bacterium]|nr:SRPBCC family protein [Deltaproteobacteria bacterium]